jgi:hypothetical protein
MIHLGVFDNILHFRGIWIFIKWLDNWLDNQTQRCILLSIYSLLQPYSLTWIMICYLLSSPFQTGESTKFAPCLRQNCIFSQWPTYKALPLILLLVYALQVFKIQLKIKFLLTISLISQPHWKTLLFCDIHPSLLLSSVNFLILQITQSSGKLNS